jgi:FtsH-binding integral membrane protein
LGWLLSIDDRGTVRPDRRQVIYRPVARARIAAGTMQFMTCARDDELTAQEQPMSYYDHNPRRTSQGMTTSPSDDALIDAGLRLHMQRVYSYMAGGLALTGIVAYAAASSGFYQAIAGTPLLWIVMLAPLGFVLALSFGIQRMQVETAVVLFWIYSAVMGLSLGSIFLVFTGASIARVFFITAATYGAMSIYGYTTRSDLSGGGSFLLMGLIGIIIASIVNIFVGSSALQFAISIIGVIVFVGLTAYDTQRIKQMYLESDTVEIAGKKAVLGALALYLDFINLFMMLLQLFGQRREN